MTDPSELGCDDLHERVELRFALKSHQVVPDFKCAYYDIKIVVSRTGVRGVMFARMLALRACLVRRMFFRASDMGE